MSTAGGNAWFAGGCNLVEVNAAGSALVVSRYDRGIEVAALALDGDSNVYGVGTSERGATFPATRVRFSRRRSPPSPLCPLSGGPAALRTSSR